jgi:S-adenosyl-L-methionine hydrolase (adenosine-forming)
VKYNTISFFSDYGIVDESVGVVKSVIRSIAPDATVLDITHDIPPFDVRTGSISLVRCANYLVPGVVLAVVDPGVGTSRRAIAVEVGEGESVLIGPDNGLLAPIVNHVGGARRVVELMNTKYQLEAPGATFAGRDIFGPAAAYLCSGVDLEELGPLVDADVLVPAVIPFSAEKDGVLSGDVLYVDRYGNVHTNVSPEQIAHFGSTVKFASNAKTQQLPVVRTFGDVNEHEPALVIDDVGLMSVIVNQGSASQLFLLYNGDTFTIS